jgi:hypothetical protein
VDDDFYLPSHGWSMLGGDMFEDERRLVVRLEVPAMDKDEFDIEVLDDALAVCGEGGPASRSAGRQPEARDSGSETRGCRGARGLRTTVGLTYARPSRQVA